MALVLVVPCVASRLTDYSCLKSSDTVAYFQGSRGDQKIRRSWRREVELDPHICPEEIMSREVELG